MEIRSLSDLPMPMPNVSVAYFGAWSSYHWSSLNHQLSEVASTARPMKGNPPNLAGSGVNFSPGIIGTLAQLLPSDWRGSLRCLLRSM
jgi:hypothetical protein